MRGHGERDRCDRTGVAVTLRVHREWIEDDGAIIGYLRLFGPAENKILSHFGSGRDGDGGGLGRLAHVVRHVSLDVITPGMTDADKFVSEFS